MARSSPALEKPRYHHGDLPRALLEGARALLNEHGLEGVTLRAVAQQAGVSQAAIRNHFRDKNALLAMLAATGHSELSSRRTGRLDAAPDLVAALEIVFVNYAEFAVENPDLFRLMFAQKDLRRREHAEFDAAAHRGYAGLSAVFESFFQREGLSVADMAAVTFDIWSAMHGLTMLVIDRQYGAIGDSRATVVRHCKALARLMAAGLRETRRITAARKPASPAAPARRKPPARY